MSMQCDCPFCPITDYNKEFKNELTMISHSKTGNIEKVFMTNHDIPENIKSSCFLLMLYGKNNLKLKPKQSTCISEKNIRIYYKQMKKEKNIPIITDVFEICFHPN